MNNELEIKLKSNADEVNKNLEALISTLNNGSKASSSYEKGLGQIVDELKNLNNSLSNSQAITNTTSQMSQGTKANQDYSKSIQEIITNMKEMKESVDTNSQVLLIATGLQKVVNSAVKLDGIDFSNFEKKLTQIMQAIQKVYSKFNDIPDNGIGTSINQLSLGVQRLNNADISVFKNNILGVTSSVEKMASTLNNVSDNSISKMINSLARSISKINELDLRKTYSSFSSLTRIIDPFLTKLKESETALTSFVNISKSLNDSAKYVSNINSEFEKYNKTVEKSKNTTTSLKSVLSSLSLVGFFNMAKKIWSFLNKGVETINSYSETLNLFNIVMGDTTDSVDELSSEMDTVLQKATQFQNTMTENLGTNSQETLYYQAMYQSLTESMGIQEEYAYIISENLTKMAYDISSLYDADQDTVAEALRAGLVGQTKPVRAYGMDITQNSLQPILDNLGIDRTVSELSQAEKEIVRYLALLEQSSAAHGDMANTIESPSNQLRVLKNQLVECSKWFGALFINQFSKAIVYINGFVMALKEVLIYLATLLNFSLEDYNTSVASYSDYLDDVSDSADDATDSIKELKKQLLGFDQVNNINENTDSDSSSGTSYEIDDRLLAALEGYDNGMESIRMKALDIRNAILDWLGFLMDGDEIVGYSLPKFLKNLVDWWGKLNTKGKLFVALGLAVVFTNIYNAAKKLVTSLGSSGLFTAVKNLLSPVGTLVKLISTEGFSSGTTIWSLTLTTMDKLKVALIGTAGLLVGFSLANDAANEFNETGEVTAGVVANLGGSLLTSATSGALMGASIGGVHGAIIGGVLGAVSSLAGFMVGLKDDTDNATDSLYDQVDSIIEYCKSVEDAREEVYNAADAVVAEYDNSLALVEELQNLTDENGKVKEGYETRVSYILNELSEAYGVEYELIDGQISKNGEAITSMEEVIDEIDKVIEKKKAEALLDTLEDNYTTALTNEKTYYQQYQKALEAYSEAQENFNKKAEEMYNNSKWHDYYEQQYGSLENFKQALIDAGDKVSLNVKEEIEALESTGEAAETARQTWENSMYDITTYEDLLAATTEEDSDKIQEAVERVTNSYEENGERVQMSLSEQLQYAIDTNELAKKNYEETGDAIYKSQYETTQKNLETVINSLKEQTGKVEELTPEVVEAWGALSEQSHDEFVEAINGLDEDVKTELLGDMKDAGYDIGEDLEAGLKESATEIETTTDEIGEDIPDDITESAETEVKKDNFFSSFWNTLSSALSKGFTGVNFASIGGNIISGITSGMTIPDLSTFGTSFISSIKSSLGIHSPSKLAMPIGVYTVLGIEEGMEDEIPNIEDTANSIIDTLQSTFDNGMYDLSLESAMTPSLTQDVSNLSTYSSDVNIDYSMLEQASYNGFAMAIQKYGLVNINVKQDKSSIVETAIDGINNITRQTGESPIDVW